MHDPPYNLVYLLNLVALMLNYKNINSFFILTHTWPHVPPLNSHMLCPFLCSLNISWYSVFIKIKVYWIYSIHGWMKCGKQCFEFFCGLLLFFYHVFHVWQLVFSLLYISFFVHILYSIYFSSSILLMIPHRLSSDSCWHVKNI